MTKKTTKDISPKDEIKLQVNDLVSEERQLVLSAHHLAMANPEFAKFLKQQKKFQIKSDLFWESIEQSMIKNDIKSIKDPSWGSLTIQERTTYKAIDLAKVPAKFIKKALDTTKIGAHLKLSGDLPKGITKTTKLSLQKRIKLSDESIKE